jgi:hypothetical protein
MKHLIPLTALAALSAASPIYAQTPAFSKPSGYSSFPLTSGFNAPGLTLQTPSLGSGALSAIDGALLTDANATFAPISGRLYVLEITSGTLIGTIQEVPAASITANTLTTTDDLQASGLQVGDTYNLRVAPTLEEIFGTTSLANGGVLDSALSVGSSDVIWVPNGSGGFAKYYLRTSGTPPVGAFRSTPANVNTPNVPVVYADGILIEKKSSTPATLTVTGEVKTNGTNSTITFGFNLVNIVAPVGLNLFNAGLDDDLFPALSANAADEVWILNPTTKAWAKYYRRSGITPSSSDSGWRLTGSSPANTPITEVQATEITLPATIIINKKNAGISPLDLNVPTSYSGL